MDAADNNSIWKAIKAYSRAIKLNPDSGKAYVNRGDAYYDAGEYDKASEDYLVAIRLYRSVKNDVIYKEAQVLHYYVEGDALAKDGKYAAALELFSKALASGQANAEVYFKRGFSYHQLGEYEKAIADYSKVISLDPTYAQIYDSRGNSYNEKEQHDLALKDYAKALDLNPKLSIVYYDLGHSHAQAGKSAEALRCFKKYLALQPSAYCYMVAWAHYSIACLHALAGRTEEALRSFELALKNGLSKREYIANDEDLDQLRAHPQFIKLMQKYLP